VLYSHVIYSLEWKHVRYRGHDWCRVLRHAHLVVTPDLQVGYHARAFAFEAAGRVTISDECDSMELTGTLVIGRARQEMLKTYFNTFANPHFLR